MTSTAGPAGTDVDPQPGPQPDRPPGPRPDHGPEPRPAVAAVRGDRRRADIQGLRAIAVVLVVLYHARLPIPAGFAGVDVFFVISGFVITGQIERLRAASRFSFVTFYARRIRRLLPAMAVMLLTVLVLALLLQSPIQSAPKTGRTSIAAVLLWGNFDILSTTGDYFAAGAVMNPLLHVWSLSVEEQFYLVFPLLLFLTWKLGRRGARRQLAALGLLTAGSFALSAWLSYASFTIDRHPATDVAFYSSPTRAWEFGVGAMLAVWAANRSGAAVPAIGRRFGPVLPTTLAAAGLVLLGVLNLTVDDRTTVWPGVAVLMPVGAALLLILAGTLGTGPLQRLLSSRPFTTVGDLSYSIYLWHWPLIVLMTLVWPHDPVAVVAAVLSLVPAWLSYRYVENPLRNGRIRLPHIYLGGAVTAAGVVVAAMLLQAVGPHLIPNAAAYAEQQGTLTFGRHNGCLVHDRAYEPSDIPKCTVTVPHAKGWVMLVGDSHAEAISTGLIEADRQLGYSTLALTGTSCPFMRSAGPSGEVNNCGPLASALLDRATKTADPPSMVVVGEWALPRHTVDGIWPQQLKPAFDEFAAAGIPVMYVMDVPNFATQSMNRLTACSGGMINFVCDRSRQEILSYQQESRRAETAFVDSMPGVTAFDTWPTFCSASTCSPLIDGKLAYYDFDHLNRIGSVALTDPLRNAVGAVLAQR